MICTTRTPPFVGVISCRILWEICAEKTVADIASLNQNTLRLLCTTVKVHFDYLTTKLPPSDVHAKQ
jgi:hypothetical protein